MTRTQWYIGAPNGVVLCIDGLHDGNPVGKLYHSYQPEPIAVGNVEQMIFQMEELYDSLNFPHPSTNERSFAPVHKAGVHFTERDRIMKDEALLSKHGDLGTFIVRVQHRQNSSWQGRITWVDEDKTIHFRSIWEMIKLIESAVDTVSGQEEETADKPHWNT